MGMEKGFRCRRTGEQEQGQEKEQEQEQEQEQEPHALRLTDNFSVPKITYLFHRRRAYPMKILVKKDLLWL